MKVSLVSLVSLVLLISGICTGIILIINLMNGNYLETVTPYSYIILDPALYPYSYLPATDPEYQYVTLTAAGKLMFKICSVCFAGGIFLVIAPAIYSIVIKW